jgi:ferredoxin
VIRRILLSTAEMKAMLPELLPTVMVKAKSRDVKNFQFQVQCSPHDCMHCELCIAIYPTKSLTNGLVTGSDQAMKFAELHNGLFVYLCDKIPRRGDIVAGKSTVKNSQFQQP